MNKQEKGSLNVEALRKYLSEKGTALPVRNGRVNVTAIARECGIGRREVLYQNPSCREMLENAIREQGLPGMETQEEQPDADRAKLERRIMQLEMKNESLYSEVHALRRELDRYRHIQELLEEGKRVIP